MATTTTTQIPSGRTEHFDKVLLINTYPFVAFHLFADVRPYPQRTGDTIKMRRYSKLTVDTTPLTEGITPDSDQLGKTDVTAQLSRYGRYVTITDDVAEENVESVKAETAELQGNQAGRILNQVYRDGLIGGTTVRYANGVANRAAVVAKVVAADLDNVVNTLVRNDAVKITKIVKASTGVGTAPIAAGFFGICHPDVTYDLEQITGWKYPHEYGNPESALPGEIGAVKRIRWIESSDCKIWADAGGAISGTRGTTATDVYATLVFAAHAYAIVPLQAEGRQMQKTNIMFITKGFGEGDDPLEQRMTMGWKFKTAVKITNDNFIDRIESAATKL